MQHKRFLLWGFKPPGDLMGVGLGPLERQVLDMVWRGGSVTVRDVHAAIGGGIAYTTVMTTLDRLFRKGLLDRAKPARAFVYSARATEKEFEESIANDLLSGLLANPSPGPLPFLSNLVDVVGERDEALLDELERLVKVKRRQLLVRND
ncbi:MAG: BlaI/MecI/CopY family transcriptional regulator [Acidobacteriota bacterium]